MLRARPLFLLAHAKQSRKCGCALSIPHSFIQSEREKEREREGRRERERESEKEGGREREMLKMVALFLFLKGMTGALPHFSYLVM